MEKVLVCPFGHFNLLLTLFERLVRCYRDRYEVTYVSFTEYGRAILRRLSAPCVHVPPSERENFFTPDVLEEVTKFSRLLGRHNLGLDLKTQLNRAANHYGAVLGELVKREGIESVVEINGRANLFVSALDAVADMSGLRKLVFELGLFRPDYVTIDGRGVNYRNSIDSLETLLGDQPLPYQQTRLFRDLTSLLPMPRNGLIDYKRRVPVTSLLAAYLRMKRHPKKWLFLRTAEGRDLMEAAVLSSRKARRTSMLDEVLASDRYRHVILCPFQVETDTQILLHSPMVKDMREFVRVVSNALARYNAGRAEKACALFKMHPMHPIDIGIKGEEIFFVNESSIREILKTRCDLVITVNSTVGIEAIEAGLPVITLGEAFYDFPGVISGRCMSMEELPVLIERALNSKTVDHDLQRRFITALRNKYQVRLH